MENQETTENTVPNTGTTHSVKAGRLDLNDAVDSLLIDPKAPSESTDTPESTDEVTAAQAAQKDHSEPSPKDAIDAVDDILEKPEAEPEEATEEPEAEAEAEAVVPEETEQEPEPEAEEVMFTSAEGDEVTLDELKKGYLRQSDYTKKTQDVATERQQLGENYKAYEQHQDVLAQHLELALNVVEPQLAQFATLDWDSLASNDAYEYAEKRALYDQAQARYNQLMRAAQDTVAQGKERQSQAQHQRLAQERQHLQMALPDMADPTKGRKLANSIKEYALSMGLNEQEASGITDHRMIVMLNKARMYDELGATQLAAAQKKLKKGPRKVVSSGKPTTKQERSASDKANLRKKLASTGSVDDGVEWLLKG